jgi:predicted nuclease of predicted toxin-antitoxin system
MRILLDEQFSPKRVGDRLARHGHDVLCVAADEALRGSTDEDVLRFAAADGRVLVTRNARDFAPLARDWVDTGQRHAGILLVWSRGTDEFGTLVEEIRAALEAVGDQQAWADTTRAL